ncbi:MAG: hypothetical protein P1U87_16070 [Verrucomicrobiales bacterium]|nr:hypothetical protein [Verrucomicrobiales bacterium]MDF2378540.1 hypothetical protein [Verrucomicrobiales bacterium]
MKPGFSITAALLFFTAGIAIAEENPPPSPTQPWQELAAKRAKFLSEVKWTPVAATMPNRKGGYFEKGKEYTGVPYSSVRQVGRYIGFDISLRTFLAAVENPASVLYTESLVGKVTNAAAFYGAVCSSYTSYALQCGLPEVSRHHGPEYSDGVVLVEPQSGSAVAVGDVIYTPPARKGGGSHIEMVTGVTRKDDGVIRSILVEESRPPTTLSTDRTVAEFDKHLAAKNKQLFRITDLDRWRNGNRADPLHYPNFATDGAPATINRSLLLDLGDWVVYQKGQPVKFHVMDRDSRGVKSLVIKYADEIVEEIPIKRTGVVERTLPDCGDYTAHVVHPDGSPSPSCHFAICDLDYTFPDKDISISKDWKVSFDSVNMKIVAINLHSLSDSYGRHPILLTKADQQTGFLTVPGGLLKKKGRLQVWLIGEHPLGRLKLVKTISMTD